MHVNGERIENESDEEESEEGEDTEEDEELVRVDGAKSSQEGPKIDSVSQVGISTTKLMSQWKNVLVHSFFFFSHLVGCFLDFLCKWLVHRFRDQVE